MLEFPTWKRVLVIGVCLFGILYAAPNFMPSAWIQSLPSWVPVKRMKLGLDLRGGAYLLMQVDTKGYLKDLMGDTYKASIRSAVNALGTHASIDLAGDTLNVQVRDPAKLDALRSRIQRDNPDLTVKTVGPSKLSAALSEKGRRDRISTLVQQSISVIRRRVDEMGTTEPLIQRQGSDRILVQVPGLKDTERLKVIIGKTAKMTFHMVDMDCNPAGRIPITDMLVQSDSPGPNGKPSNYCIEKRVRLTGQNLVDAQPTFQDARPVVSFRFDARGARMFGQITRTNVGRLFAIVLDNKVITAPRIEEPILGGSGVIRGNFTAQSAKDLAILLRAGALPASMIYLEERSVGPGLGQDSIDAGKEASVLGMILVVVFMFLGYGLFGLMADIALLFNVALILALLSVLQATLTLPGIAGIALTIGMAVDANVLIFERMREEVRNGRSPLNATDAGYSRALTTIIDSNLTTLIAGALLFVFGSGPIKGFGVTLTIGIVSSMFTAIMVTRFMVVMWLRRKRPQTLPI
jgi:preprotein translocase subunit SecD